MTTNIPITEPDQLLFTIYNKKDATCFPEDLLDINPPSAGSCDGQIMVNITGGSGPYSYDLDETGIYPLVNTEEIPTPGDSLFLHYAQETIQFMLLIQMVVKVQFYQEE